MEWSLNYFKKKENIYRRHQKWEEIKNARQNFFSESFIQNPKIHSLPGKMPHHEGMLENRPNFAQIERQLSAEQMI